MLAALKYNPRFIGQSNLQCQVKSNKQKIELKNVKYAYLDNTVTEKILKHTPEIFELSTGIMYNYTFMLKNGIKVYQVDESIVG